MKINYFSWRLDFFSFSLILMAVFQELGQTLMSDLFAVVDAGCQVVDKVIFHGKTSEFSC